MRSRYLLRVFKRRKITQPVSDKDEKLAVLRSTGDALRDAGQVAKAAETYGAYLELNKSDFDIWVQKGNCEKDAGIFAGASESYSVALGLRPNDADLFLQMGHLCKLSGDRSGALRAYQAAYNLSSSSDAADEISRIHMEMASKQIDIPNSSETESNDELKSIATTPFVRVATKQNHGPIRLVLTVRNGNDVSGRKEHLAQRVSDVARIISKQSVTHNRSHY